MYPVSARFKEALKHSHVVATRCDVVSASGVVLATLGITDGYITVDPDSDTLRRAYIVLEDPTGDLTPADASDLLHPLSNNRFFLYRGIKFPDGTEELVPQGRFHIYKSSTGDSGDSVNIQVDGYDRSRWVADQRLLNTYVVPAGTQYDVAIHDLLETIDPGAVYNFTPIEAVTPEIVLGNQNEASGGGSPWEYAQEMAESVGADLYIDVDDVYTLRPVPGVVGSPVVWSYKEGEEATILYVDRTHDREETFNHVVVSGENTDNDDPVRGEAKDEDPNSPTYYAGPFGDVPTFIQSEYVTSEAQANTLAAAKLSMTLGVKETLQITSIPNPAHEHYDVVEIRRDRIGLSKKALIENFTMPMKASQPLNIGIRDARSF